MPELNLDCLVSVKVVCPECSGDGMLEIGMTCRRCDRLYDDEEMQPLFDEGGGRMPCGHYTSELRQGGYACRACAGSGYVQTEVSLREIATLLGLMADQWTGTELGGGREPR